MDEETFSCPNCRTAIFVADVRHTDAAICSNCGHRYLLEFDDFEAVYHLVPQEPPQYPTDIDTERI
ncbi:MAG: hypothetical protein WDA20_03835 [Desulfuromonadales bacterium]|jgi:ribosomal protein S27AE